MKENGSFDEVTQLAMFFRCERIQPKMPGLLEQFDQGPEKLADGSALRHDQIEEQEPVACQAEVCPTVSANGDNESGNLGLSISTQNLL